ncbi:MAG: GNAT family N-acetyltransferase [Pseudomonadota bacterium]
MPKYLEEYKKAISGQLLFIACREGLLRNYLSEIISDLKFVIRQNSKVIFFHNIPKSFANDKILSLIKNKLYLAEIVRVPNTVGFYDFVLNYRRNIYKIIFLERNYLLNTEGMKISTLTTKKALERFEEYGHLIANQNFKKNIELICKKVQEGIIDRVFIIPAGKNMIKRELFTLEGSGTLITNNFIIDFCRAKSKKELTVVSGILKSYKKDGFLKYRSENYKNEFYMAKIDNIIVGCIEAIKINSLSVELGGLAVSFKYLNQEVGIFLINSFINQMKRENFNKVISLTNNPKLKNIYLSLGFKQESPIEFKERQKESPKVNMFVKNIN